MKNGAISGTHSSLQRTTGRIFVFCEQLAYLSAQVRVDWLELRFVSAAREPLDSGARRGDVKNLSSFRLIVDERNSDATVLEVELRITAFELTDFFDLYHVVGVFGEVQYALLAIEERSPKDKLVLREFDVSTRVLKENVHVELALSEHFRRDAHVT